MSEEEVFFIFFCYYLFERWLSGEEVFYLFYFFLQGGCLGEKVAGLQGGSVGPDHLQARLAKLHRANIL